MGHPFKYKTRSFLIIALCTISMVIAMRGVSRSFKSDTTAINALLKDGYALADKNADSAILLIWKGINLSETLNYVNGIVSGYGDLGYAYFVVGDHDKSRSFFLKALAVNNGNNEEDRIARLYSGIGNSYAAQGNYTEASVYYFKSLHITEESLNDKGWTDTVDNVYFQELVKLNNNLARVFSRLNQPDKVIFYLKKGEQITRLKKNYVGLCYILNNMSRTLLPIDSLALAEKDALEALALSYRYNILITRPYSLTALGDVYSKENKITKAIKCYNEAIAESKAADLKMFTTLSLAELYIQHQQYSLSEKLLLESEDFSKKHKLESQLIHIYSDLSDLYSAQKKYEKAFYAQVELGKLNDSFTVREKKKDINLMEIKYRSAQKDKSIAEDRLLLAQQDIKIKKKNTLIVGISAVICVIVGFFVLFYLQRQRIQTEKIKAMRDEEKINMLLSVVKGEEKERNRLAGELHDGIGGLLSTVKMFFSNIQKKEASIAAYPGFYDAMNLLDETITEVRKTAHNLMPELLFNYGLPEATRLFCDTFQKANNIKVSFQYYGFIGRLNRGFELFLYRILQELLQNISKHANATEALVQISLHDNILSITIEDNGTGIMPDGNNNGGMGLQIIKSRVNDLDGQFIVNSGMTGTSVYIEIDTIKQDKFTS